METPYKTSAIIKAVGLIPTKAKDYQLMFLMRTDTGKSAG